jgi:hypothetical protein
VTQPKGRTLFLHHTILQDLYLESRHRQRGRVGWLGPDRVTDGVCLVQRVGQRNTRTHASDEGDAGRLREVVEDKGRVEVQRLCRKLEGGGHHSDNGQEPAFEFRRVAPIPVRSKFNRRSDHALVTVKDPSPGVEAEHDDIRVRIVPRV